MSHPLVHDVDQDVHHDVVQPGPTLRLVPTQPTADSSLGVVDLARWERAWEHRPLLLALARQRVRPADAEDVVSDAILRAATAGAIERDALRAWLVTTTLRLCADRQRQEARERRRTDRLAAYEQTEVPAVDDEVVDREHALWVAAQVDRLPARQAEALRRKASGQDIAHIAVAMVLPYKAVESLLSRGRRGVRGWLAALVVVIGGWRTLAKRKVQLHVAATALGAAGEVAYEAARTASSIVSKTF